MGFPKSEAERENISHGLDEAVYNLIDTDPTPDSTRTVDGNSVLFPKFETYTVLSFCFVNGQEALCYTDDFVPPTTYYIVIYSDNTWEKFATGGVWGTASPTRIGGGTYTKT